MHAWMTHSWTVTEVRQTAKHEPPRQQLLKPGKLVYINHPFTNSYWGHVDWYVCMNNLLINSYWGQTDCKHEPPTHQQLLRSGRLVCMNEQPITNTNRGQVDWYACYAWPTYQQLLRSGRLVCVHARPTYQQLLRSSMLVNMNNALTNSYWGQVDWDACMHDPLTNS